jgi:hypothetical protein
MAEITNGLTEKEQVVISGNARPGAARSALTIRKGP